MANTAFDHAPTITVPSSSTANAIVTWNGTTGKSFNNTALTFNGNLLDVRNDGTASAIRLYCESSNAHYASIQAPAHASFSGNVTLTLPAVTGTIATTDEAIAMAIALG